MEEALRITSAEDFERAVIDSYSFLQKAIGGEKAGVFFPTVQSVRARYIAGLTDVARRQHDLVDCEYGTNVRCPIAQSAHYLSGIYEQVVNGTFSEPPMHIEKLEQCLKEESSSRLMACRAIGSLHAIEENIAAMKMTLDLGLGLYQHDQCKTLGYCSSVPRKEWFKFGLSVADRRFRSVYQRGY
jgi:hypothetical protein